MRPKPKCPQPCPERHPGCQSTCPKQAAYLAEIAADNAKKDDVNEADLYMFAKLAKHDHQVKNHKGRH